MNWKDEWKWLTGLAGAFLVLFYLPVGIPRFNNAVLEGLYLAKSYAQEHVILCLLPAFFIAGAIGVFLSQNTVMKYLGADAKKVLAYGVASVSGTILAVCSCTILPLFAGIYRMGAGLGPAVAFLYSGPAINVLAIILTARILGIELGIARAVGAIVFSVVIGLIMHFVYRHERQGQDGPQMMLGGDDGMRPLWQNILYFAAMIAVLVFANWGRPQAETGFWHLVYASKWIITAASAAGLGVMLVAWFAVPVLKVVAVAAITTVFSLAFPHTPMVGFMVGVIGLSFLTSTQEGEMQEWFSGSWGFAKQIMPILFAGVLVAGFLLGRPGHEGVIPSVWVSSLVGGNSLFANFIASVAGAFMYFATLTEVPILQGLMGSGMGKGPALALLLAGPAVSLPNMLVIRSVIGTGKTVVYVTLVIVMATISGFLYGTVF
ncbi:MAG TPA: permease [Deltaproteobacteria bacterium]|nr:permease [Deltaproteobacteria bacterium]